MERADILGRRTPSDALKFEPSETENGLNAVLVYQNPLTRKWADQVCDQVTRVAGKDAVRCNWWEISRLRDPEVFRDAVLMTAVANVILVSIYDANALPDELGVWIDAWLERRYQQTGALIALISVPGLPGDQTNHARDYLRNVARKGQLDFLLRERRLPVKSRGYFYMEKAREVTDRTTSVLQEALTVEHGNISLLFNDN